MSNKTVLKRKKRKAAGRGALMMIAALLVGSAFMRVGENAGQAFARSPDEPTDETELSPATAQPDSIQTAEDLRPLLEAFQAREARIAQQEDAIKNRLRALSLAEEEIGKKLLQLEQAEANLSATLALADTAAEGDLERLTKVYESMKPKQAAALFEEMAPEFAAGFLGRMRPDAAAAIMAGLSPEAAHMFSVVLAGRNAEVPKE